MSISTLRGKWRSELSMETGRDFERSILPFVRLLWPLIKQCHALRHWDAKGIDLLVWEESGRFPCVIQCKGFEVRELGYEQIRQARESIEKFRKSGETCQTYLLIYNRTSPNTEFHSKIMKQLDQLVIENIADRAEIWDIDRLLNEAFARLETLIVDALHARSQDLLRRTENLLSFGKYYIPQVPVAEKRMVFSRGEPCKLQEVHDVEVMDISQALLDRKDIRWTILVGTFGSGKSMAALHACSSSRVVIYIPSSTLEATYHGMGRSHKLPESTTVLFQTVAQSLQLLDEDALEDQDRDTIYNLTGPILLSLLKRPNSQYVFILDALDETRAYTTLPGMQMLNNQLVEVECAIVLTTRSEHLASMFGDFSTGFYGLATKHRPRRAARLLELAPWSLSEINQLLDQILLESTGLEKERLSELQTRLNSTDPKYLYGDLPLNPLFLQFLLDDVVAEGVRPTNRLSLIWAWIRRKIERDRTSANRPSPDYLVDTEDFVDRMIQLMENIANAMTEKSNGTYQIIEAITSTQVEQEADRLFRTLGATSNSVLSILLNSVLVTGDIRRGSHLPITFVFRVLHEFFLACYLTREKLSDVGYPDAVRELYAEMLAYIEAEPNTSLAEHFRTYQANQQLRRP